MLGPILALKDQLIETEYALSFFKWQNIIFFILIVLTAVVAKQLYTFTALIKMGQGFNRSAFKLDDQLTDADNKAVSISFSSYMFASMLVTYGALSDLSLDPEDQPENVLVVVVWTLIGFLFLFIAGYINDKIVLPRVLNIESIAEDRNIAVACVEAGGYISAGQVTMASISGPFYDWGDDIALAVLYFVFSQIGFVVFAKIYGFVLGYDLQREIEVKNPAAGLAFGLDLIAVGQLVSNPVMKSDSILNFWVVFVLGMIALFILRKFTDLVLLPKDSLNSEIQQDHNWGAALIEGAVSNMFAYSISALLPDICLLRLYELA